MIQTENGIDSILLANGLILVNHQEAKEQKRKSGIYVNSTDALDFGGGIKANKAASEAIRQTTVAKASRDEPIYSVGESVLVNLEDIRWIEIDEKWYGLMGQHSVIASLGFPKSETPPDADDFNSVLTTGPELRGVKFLEDES